MAPRDVGLTPKQHMFVKEYLVDLNATQAAIRAGYSARTANRMGTENLAKPVIASAIQEAMDKRADRLELTAELVLSRIDRIAQAAESKDEYQAALKANELLGKHLKLFTDKVELETTDALAELLSKARQRAKG